MDCLFCKIANKTLDAKIIHQDDQITVFEDINPKAPTHLLIIPNKHIPTLNDTEPTDQALLGHMLLTAADLAKQLKIAGPGYRVLMNCNGAGGQEVYHIHLHLLGGREMRWPPG